MNVLELFRVAWSGLSANRLRSLLTMLGIIIGVTAVIALMTMGQGFQNYVSEQFNSLGSNLLFIAAVPPTGPNSKNIKPKPMTLDDAEAIANPLNVSGVAGVASQYDVPSTVTANGNSVVLATTGVDPNWADLREWPVQLGRFIEPEDMTTSARIVVLGTSAAEELFSENLDDALGQEVFINKVPFRVVGILASKGVSGPIDLDMVVRVPLTTAQSRLGRGGSRTASGEYIVSLVYVKAANGDSVNAIKSQVEALLSERHAVQFKGQEDFIVVTQEQVLAILNNVIGLITIFLAMIAGISLVVGGIGVMNIMLVSVTERTREIGLRKALGARYRDLMLQFLIESVLLCLTGGAIGIALGALSAFAAAQAIPSLRLSITLPTIMLATSVSTITGIFFGLYPASRAASMNPIEALRYE